MIAHEEAPDYGEDLDYVTCAECDRYVSEFDAAWNEEDGVFVCGRCLGEMRGDHLRLPV